MPRNPVPRQKFTTKKKPRNMFTDFILWSLPSFGQSGHSRGQQNDNFLPIFTNCDKMSRSSSSSLTFGSWESREFCHCMSGNFEPFTFCKSASTTKAVDRHMYIYRMLCPHTTEVRHHLNYDDRL